MSEQKNSFLEWIDKRFPMTATWRAHLSEYYAPKNFNFWYFFGSLALLVLVNQLITGIFLTMSYKPDSSLAFASVEYIMRDVEYGWLIRYMHSTGASMFFVVVYLHMFRGMIYGSYRKPRELLWLIGMAIFFVLMSLAFTGYILPWGQMSYWGAQVIVSMFEAIPLIGETLHNWILGDFMLSDAALNRFFAYHVVTLPVLIVVLVFVHVIALHEVGSNNPDGIEIKENKNPQTKIPVDGIPFHPYYTVKDIFGVVVFLIVFCGIIFFAPEMGGYFLEHNNFIPANTLQTPDHIAPVWYFTPYYSMLRAVTVNFLGVDAKLWGVILMVAGVAVFCFLPWLDRSPVKSIRYKGPIFKTALTLFVISFFVLGWLGTQSPTPVYTLLAQIFSVIYFAFFVLMPWYSKIDKTKPEPKRVTK
ncbi:MAG: cytochrome bc complex cytochrome b subunit [Burkholderiales bacterium]|uniref:cytochrome b n=1 Tax=Nitrosomonas sp. TaxID=42353 RepID=UPI001D6E4033|nr:cytochrome bc complex cytochrome b subunit [Nitrosomonas sp.]MCB1949829.1 cytochrome bc complex cytochrome b subunit [Nitrosomonas sp.]MCP5246324.1 cytochrome bc complex cytochrome b subunit [Burkholderiales bacterium]MDR4515643.1 cytochrome bc complex cytochrome b subunit [Nitrosomonas sp.]